MFTLNLPSRSRQRFFLPLILAWVLTGWLSVGAAAIPGDNVAAIWLPSGVGVVALLVLGRAGLLCVWLASLLVTIPATAQLLDLNTSWRMAIPAAALDALQAYLAMRAWRLHEARYHANFLRQPQDLPWFWLWVCLVPVLVTAPLMTLLQWFCHALPDASTAGIMRHWLMLVTSNTAGILLIAPCYVIWRDRSRWSLRFSSIHHWWSILLALMILAGALLLYPPALVLLLPVLLATTIRYRLPGMVIAILICAMATALATAYRLGPFVHANPTISFVNLQLFLFSTTVMLQYLALAQELIKRHRIQLESEVAARTEALAQANERLKELATTDELTGAPNRREWQRRCAQAVLLARRQDTPLSILLLDLDHFKQVNDTYGHLIGDLMLRAVTHACRESLRASDSFGRWGGEEFVVVLPDTPLGDAQQVAEKLRLAISATHVPLDGGEYVRITASMGVSRLRPSDVDLDDLLTRADHALYHAKEYGRNRVVLETELPANELPKKHA
ncbi:MULTISPECIES: sensor domain-containing diguanylate cyclase [Silvimonas]|uniref:sensor domain-containing diguanylate cyclase n=1 Tax=Silvimonas TaxID=300264 RepID=UPI0024B3489A|nr:MULTISPECIES: diguanylate cyclase [Silvimonas]MDR3428831.1 diguanylate cyclase [Silvimonas sp.]